MRLQFADHEETYNAGEVYYAAPGHTAAGEAGCQYVELSPADEYRKTMEVAVRNMQAGK